MAASPATSPSGFGRAIDILAKAANFTPIRQEVTLADGSEFVFWAAPLSAAEREKAQKESGPSGDFGVQLLLLKALDENGQRLFKAGDIPRLKHDVEDEDLQKLIFCILKPRGEEGEKQPDKKSA